MDDSLSAGRKPKRFFSDEFKPDAVRLIVEEKYTFKSAAEALGVGKQSLRQWHTKLALQREPCGENVTPVMAVAAAISRRSRAERDRGRLQSSTWQLLLWAERV